MRLISILPGDSQLRLPTILIALVLVTTLMLLGTGCVLAAYTPVYYGGEGGTISGTVISPTGTLVDWSQIHATDGNQTFEAFSGFSGFYLMRVPAGTYNVSVYDPYSPEWWAQSANVTVTDESTTTVNFYMQSQPSSPVPEFQPGLVALLSILALVATCVASRPLRKGRRSVFV